tara:strand:- start:263 stop:766 length:504 start_codon:yes stop_codon:yes gene_type:complete
MSRYLCVWGQFDVQSTNKINKIKKEVNTLLSGPYFDIHLTISNPINDNNNVDSIIKNISQNNKIIKIYTNGISMKDNYFESLFINISKNNHLISLKNLIDKEFNIKYREFFPHISLFYGNVPKKEKMEIIKLLTPPKTITLNNISLVNVDESIEQWKILKSFKLNNL